MRKDDLFRLKELTKELAGAEDRIILLRAQAERITAMLDGLPRGSLMRSKIEESVVKLVTAADDLENKRSELLSLQAELITDIAYLPALESTVIRMKYLEGWSFRTIAATFKCSVGHIFKAHRRALKKFLTA